MSVHPFAPYVVEPRPHAGYLVRDERTGEVVSRHLLPEAAATDARIRFLLLQRAEDAADGAPYVEPIGGDS